MASKDAGKYLLSMPRTYYIIEALCFELGYIHRGGTGREQQATGVGCRQGREMPVTKDESV
jgi:hypothetical protein